MTPIYRAILVVSLGIVSATGCNLPEFEAIEDFPELRAPVYEASLSGEIIFRWRGVEGADSYTLTILDRPVAEVEPIWGLDMFAAVPEGTLRPSTLAYSWHVVAQDEFQRMPSVRRKFFYDPSSAVPGVPPGFTDEPLPELDGRVRLIRERQCTGDLVIVLDFSPEDARVDVELLTPSGETRYWENQLPQAMIQIDEAELETGAYQVTATAHWEGESFPAQIDAELVSMPPAPPQLARAEIDRCLGFVYLELAPGTEPINFRWSLRDTTLGIPIEDTLNFPPGGRFGPFPANPSHSYAVSMASVDPPCVTSGGTVPLEPISPMIPSPPIVSGDCDSNGWMVFLEDLPLPVNFQIATDPDFTQIVATGSTNIEHIAPLPELPDGHYYARYALDETSGCESDWSPVRSFEMPLPAALSNSISVGPFACTLEDLLTWIEVAPQDSIEYSVGRAGTDPPEDVVPLTQLDVGVDEATLIVPEPGPYTVRWRTIGPGCPREWRTAQFQVLPELLAQDAVQPNQPYAISSALDDGELLLGYASGGERARFSTTPMTLKTTTSFFPLSDALLDIVRDGTDVYVSHGTGAIGRYTVASSGMATRHALRAVPHVRSLAWDANRQQLWATVAPDQVVAFDSSLNEVLRHSIRWGCQVDGLVVRPDGQLIVGDHYCNKVSVVDAVTGQVLHSRGYASFPLLQSPRGMTMLNDREVIISVPGSQQLIALDAMTLNKVADVGLGAVFRPVDVAEFEYEGQTYLAVADLRPLASGPHFAKVLCYNGTLEPPASVSGPAVP